MKYVRQIDGQIRASEDLILHDDRIITKGTLGGKIDSSRNLAQSGKCWVFPDAEVTDGAYVSGNAIIESDSIISDSAKVYGNAIIQGGKVSGEARVLGEAVVKNEAEVGDEAHVIGNVILTNECKVFGKARVQGEAIIDGGIIKDDAVVMGKPLIFGTVEGKGRVSDCVYVDAVSIVRGKASGCVQLVRTVLEPNSIVTGDHVLEDAVIEDPSLATSCPERVPRLNEECCTPREVYLCVDRLQEGEVVRVRASMQEALETMLTQKGLPFRILPFPCGNADDPNYPNPETPLPPGEGPELVCYELT